MKSLIVLALALALTSIAAFSNEHKKEEAKTEVKAEATCANLKGKELAACEEKAKAEHKAEAKKEDHKAEAKK